MKIKPAPATPNQPEEKPLIIGVGGAGSTIVKYMAQFEWSHANIAICTTDIQELPQTDGKILSLQLGGPPAKGAGGDIKDGERIASEELDKIKDFVSNLNPNVAILIAGLGKGTGGGVSPLLGRELKKQGALTIGIVIWPAEFEGERVNKQAQQALERLREFIDAYVIMRFEKFFLSEKNIIKKGGFSHLNETVTQIAYALSNLFTVSGINRISTKDMEAILHSSGSKEILVGVGMSSGENSQENAQQEPQQALQSATTEALNTPYSTVENILSCETVHHLIAHIQVDDSKCSLSTNDIYTHVIKPLQDNFHEALPIQPVISAEPIYTGACVAVTLIATGTDTTHTSPTVGHSEQSSNKENYFAEEDIHELEKEPAIFRVRKETLKRLIQ